jgi:hypothetical protein
MSIFTNVLDAHRHQVLREIGPRLTEHGFYLGGGTALALQLGHRISVDFDWFRSEPIVDPLRLKVQVFGRRSGVVIRETAPGTLHLTVDGVSVSMLEYSYPSLRHLIYPRDLPCSLAAPADLATMKLSAIADRGAKKDFVDIYALVVAKASLRTLLRWYRQRFGPESLPHVMRSLVYFDDAARQRMPRMLWPLSWPTVKAAMERWVLELIR